MKRRETTMLILDVRVDRLRLATKCSPDGWNRPLAITFSDPVYNLSYMRRESPTYTI